MFNFRSLASKLMFFLLLNLILIPSIGYTAEKFIVRFIYFKPQAAPPADHEKYEKIMKDMQEFFRNEMIRHDFGNKTFKFEKDAKGDLRIHTINGKHAGDHYTGEVFLAYYNKISKEIPFHLNNTTNREQQDNIYIVIVGGVDIVNDGRGSPWGGGWTFFNSLGGTAIINENFEKLYPNHFTSIIAHEFAHAFGLKHTEIERSLMGSLPFGGPSFITVFEARFLSEQHFFNDDHTMNPPPVITGDLETEAIGRNIVRFKVHVRGSVNLYHIQLSQGPDYTGSSKLEGKNTIAQIDVLRSTITEPYNFTTTVFDVNGNRGGKDFLNIQIPEPILVNDNTFKYLTIRDKQPDSLVPINNPQEWCGWENAGVFEKIPDGVSPKLPPWYFHVPKLDEWDSWFYSHAKARFVYDISGGVYNRFEARFYLPCEGNADVEVMCFADDIEIYRSEILRAPAAQNKHFQIDFPKDTKEFTIEITDAGDGIRCDHFVFGEARVLQVLDNDTNPPEDKKEDGDLHDVVCEHCIPPDTDIEIDGVIEEDLSIDPKGKLTTKWATIKARK